MILGEVYTPFLIAVRNGHTQLVRVLLEQFQIKQSQHCGTLNFDGYLIEGDVLLQVCVNVCFYSLHQRVVIECIRFMFYLIE